MTVSVIGSHNTTATGTVTLFDGATALATLPLGGDGRAYWYISPGLAVGTHPIYAVYSGDANNGMGGSAPVLVNVMAISVNLSTSCWNNSFAYGQDYSCTVTVSSNAGPASGVATFIFDSTPPVTVALNNGNAQFTVPKPAVGNHILSIQYTAQGNFASSTISKQNLTVVPAPVVENLTASSYWAHQGTSIALSAALSSWSAGTPNQQGTVSFYDNGVLLGKVQVGSNGIASLATNNLALGSHSIQASYSGTAQYATATNSLSLSIAQ